MTIFETYLFTRLDNLIAFFIFTGIIFLLISFLILLSLTDISSSAEKTEKIIFIKKVWKVTLPITIISWFMVVFIPNTKEAAFIYIAPKIINNKDFQQTLTRLPKLTNLGLEYLNNLLEEK